MFQLLNLYLWQALHCTLHIAQCKSRAAPAPENAPESEQVHFILHIEHCALHTTCLSCILQIYHFTLQTCKIYLCWSQDLHDEMYLDILWWYARDWLGIGQGIAGDAQYMPIYAEGMTNICQIYADSMLKISSRYAQDKPKICPRYVQDVHNICPMSLAPQACLCKVVKNWIKFWL